MRKSLASSSLLALTLIVGTGCSGANTVEPSYNSAGTAGTLGTAGAAAGGTGGTAGTGSPLEGGAGSNAAGFGGDTAGGSANAGAGGLGGVSAGQGGVAGNGGTDVGGQGGDAAGGAAGAGGTGGVDNSKPSCLPAFQGVCTPDVTFQNDESAGAGAMFDQVIPDAVATVQEVACTVCSILFREAAEAEAAAGPTEVTLHIYDFDGVANAGGGTLNFSSRHVANYTDAEEALFEYRGVLLHEITHLYQYDSGGGALVEGMADFVRIRGGHHHLNRRSTGGAWTDPYTTSGFFFSWLAGPGYAHEDGRMPADPDIGWAINQQMKTEWDEAVFVDRLGADVNTLWAEYQAGIQ